MKVLITGNWLYDEIIIPPPTQWTWPITEVIGMRMSCCDREVREWCERHGVKHTEFIIGGGNSPIYTLDQLNETVVKAADAAVFFFNGYSNGRIGELIKTFQATGKPRHIFTGR